MAEYPGLAQSLESFGKGISGIVQDRLWEKEYEDFKSGPLSVYQQAMQESSAMVAENPEDPDIGMKSWQIYKKATMDLFSSSTQYRKNPIVGNAVQQIFQFNQNLPGQLLQQQQAVTKAAQGRETHEANIGLAGAQTKQALGAAKASEATALLRTRQAGELGGALGGYSKEVAIPKYIHDVQNPKTKEQIANKTQKIAMIQRRERIKIMNSMQGKKNPLSGVAWGDDTDADTLYVESKLNADAIKKEAERQIVVEDAGIRGWDPSNTEQMASMFGALGFKVQDEVAEALTAGTAEVTARQLPRGNVATILGETAPGSGESWLELPEKEEGKILTSKDIKEVLPTHYSELLENDTFLATPMGWAMMQWREQGLVDPDPNGTGEEFKDYKEFKAYLKDLIEGYIQKRYNRGGAVTSANEKRQQNRSIHMSREQAREFMLRGGESFLERYAGQLAREYGLKGAPEEWKGFGEVLWGAMKEHPAMREGGAFLEALGEGLHLSRPEGVAPPIEK